MPEPVKIIECPRDAWQALPAQISAKAKAGYLRMLIDAGFSHIDAVSFVSPNAVPQMADSERVLEILNPPATVEIIGIVVNEKGVDRAIATGAVRTLGFPYSISREFLRRNQNQTTEEALKTVKMVTALAREAGLNAIAYISMAFGNPYGESFSPEDLAGACARLMDAGVQQISLADTVGIAPSEWVAEIFGTIAMAHSEVEIGVHLHARREDAAAKVLAAYNAGCRRFDSAIGGLGGCPFAQDALVGNLPTEIVVKTLAEIGALPPPLPDLHNLLRATAEIAESCGAGAH